MEAKFKFTEAMLDRLTCPLDKTRVHFQDATRPELLLQVTNKGGKSYYCRSWNAAKGYTDRIYLGKFEQIDLRDARRRARETAVLADQDQVPIVPKRILRKDITFGKAFDSFIAAPAKRKKKGPRRPATTKDYLRQYERYLNKKFSTRKLSTIEFSELDDFHTHIGEDNGPYAANRALTLISGVFHDAMYKGWSGKNPAQGIEPFPERRRNRFLEEHELGPFIKACEADSSTVAEAVLVALFTGLRRTNVCSASWQHIDLQRGMWSIPDTQMKNGHSHTIYLCEYIKSILVKRFENRTSDEWVFPSFGKTGHIVEPKKGLLKIAELAAIDPQGVNMHCLKHTFVTYADDLGLPSAVRKRLAAHKGTSDVTDGYTHARESRVQEAYEQVSQHMLSFAK